MQGQTSDFTANGIKSRKHNGFGGIVHDNFHPGSRFESSDITTFTPDNTALDFIGFDMEYRNRVFDSRFGRYPLDTLYHDTFRFLVGRHFGIVHNVVDIRGCLRLGFFLQRFYQTFFRFFGRDSRKVFEPFHFGLMEFFQFLFFLLYHFELSIEVGTNGIGLTFLLLQVLLLLGKLHFPLFQFSLGRLYLGIAGIRLLFHFGFHVDKLLFHFEQLVFLNYFGFFFGLFQNRFRPSRQQIAVHQKDKKPPYDQTANH